MATSRSSITCSSTDTERNNFLRLAQGILGPGTVIARDVLQRYITPYLLSQKVNNNLSIGYRLNKEQRNLVTNASSDGYRKFDITLIYYLLRNLVSDINDPSKPKFPNPTRGWGKSPQPLDHSISDDVERLRILRNHILSHASSASLHDSIYQTAWQQLKDIANRMGRELRKDYDKKLEDLESYTMTEAQWKDMFSKIQSIKENLENLTKEVRDIVMYEAQETRNQFKRLSSDMSNQEMYCSESEKENLQSKLLRINECETQTIPVSPLQKSMTLPIDLLYVSVVVRENFEYHHRRRKRKLEAGRVNMPKETKKSEVQSSDESNSDSEDSSEPEGSTSESLCTCTEEEESEESDSFNTSTSSSEDEAELPSDTEQQVDDVADQNDNQHDSNERHHKIINGPGDIFLKDGTPVRYVFMLGRAAHGKTVYCLKLLQNWCNTQINRTATDLNDWEEFMKNFDFVFFVPLRHVQKSRASVNEMITKDIFKHDKECENAIKYVLSSEKFRSLIIIDGLDEWNPNKEVVNQLTCKGMPNFEDMSCCTIFITSRPSKFHEVANIVRDTDRVIEILGLNDNQLKTVVSNVLTNFYGIRDVHDDHKAVYKEILEKSREKKMKSFMRIPLLAIAFVQIYFEKKTVRESLTSFYIALVDLLIKRALGKDQIPTCFQEQKAEDLNVDSILLRMIEPTENIAKFLPILLLLGKVAFDSLKPKAGRLVFTKEDLVQKVGENELQFALHTGLLTRTEAPGSFNEENVMISFFHKTVQEFLAAFYLSQNEEKLNSFLDNLSDLQSIMDFSYLIIFVSGLAPSLARTMSKCFPGIVEQDKNACRWITKPNRNHWNKVKMFFGLQVDCLKEMDYSSSLQKQDSKKPVTNFCFAMVYLDTNSDREITNTIADALKGPSIDIAHFCLKGVSNDSQCGINDIALKNFLDKTTSVKSLAIFGDHKDRTLHTIITTSLESLELSNVTLHNPSTGDDLEYPMLSSEMTRLRRIRFYGINFGDRRLGLSLKMDKLESIQFSKVKMSEKGWKGFFHTFSTLQQQCNVTIQECNIAADIYQYIPSVEGFSVTSKIDEITSESVMEIKKTLKLKPRLFEDRNKK